MNAAGGLDVETRAILCDGFDRYTLERRNRGDDFGGDPDSTARIRAEWQHLARTGWLGFGLPTASGGYGGVAELGLLLRAAGAGLWAVPLVQCLGEACGALLAAPRGLARDGLLHAIVAGEAIAGLAAVDLDAMSPTVAARAGTRFRLTGRKRFLLQGSAWTHVLVSAECAAGGGSGLYLVDLPAPGVTLRSYTAVDGCGAVDASFDGVMAEPIAQGSQALSAAQSRGRLLASAEETGLANAAWEATRRHLADRIQFGQRILQFQAIRHRLVEAHICIREVECLLDHVQSALDTGHPDGAKLLLQLRAQASSTATRTTQLAVQMHGGMGMTAAMPLGDFYKRAMLLGNLFGSAQSALDQLTETLQPDRIQPFATVRRIQGTEHAD